ncbi:MAG: exo-alpha-sialidase [Ignavibacteriae bacterium]|nr:exo-alpha-sialidase [Ignavibacteriota bacterium]
MPRSVWAVSILRETTTGTTADGTLYRSTDHGATWTALETPVKWSSGYTTAWAFSRDGDLYFARDGEATGIMRSTDMGATWTIINEGLTTTRVIPLLCHPNGFVYAGTNGAGVFRTKDPLLTGTATLTLRTAARIGQPPYASLLRYRLTDSAHVSVREVTAPPESAAIFPTLLAGDRYGYTVRQTVAGPWRDLFLGEKGPLAIADHEVKADTLVPSTPYITGVVMQIDSSGELLPPGGRHLVSPGTKIRVTVDVKNPAAAESVAVRLTALFDRDTTGTSDLSAVFDAVTIAGVRRRQCRPWCNPCVRGSTMHRSVSGQPRRATRTPSPMGRCGWLRYSASRRHPGRLPGSR